MMLACIILESFSSNLRPKLRGSFLLYNCVLCSHLRFGTLIFWTFWSFSETRAFQATISSPYYITFSVDKWFYFFMYRFPASGLVYDYFVDVKKHTFALWEEKLTAKFIVPAGAPFFKIQVPTIDTVQFLTTIILFISICTLICLLDKSAEMDRRCRLHAMGSRDSTHFIFCLLYYWTKGGYQCS